ncbi:MAG TPA: hypothetical protein VEA69_16875 [Tepidisphaeraceae bacterium]|nr:hypothetical protein [Tepidisphaeraceae bacterium]
MATTTTEGNTMTTTQELPEATTRAPDPLRTLTLPEVIRRTGISRTTIARLLALDVANGTPGVNFAAPLRRTDTRELRWREVTLLAWMEKKEGAGQ